MKWSGNIFSLLQKYNLEFLPIPEMERKCFCVYSRWSADKNRWSSGSRINRCNCFGCLTFNFFERGRWSSDELSFAYEGVMVIENWSDIKRGSKTFLGSGECRRISDTMDGEEDEVWWGDESTGLVREASEWQREKRATRNRLWNAIVSRLSSFRASVSNSNLLRPHLNQSLKRFKYLMEKTIFTNEEKISFTFHTTFLTRHCSLPKLGKVHSYARPIPPCWSRVKHRVPELVFKWNQNNAFIW